METAESLISFESGISPERAEETIGVLDSEWAAGHKVALQFVGYPYVNAGAGWRIGNAMRPFGNTSSLEVEVPPFDLGTGWFRTFNRSGIGDAIAAHSAIVMSDGSDITGRVRDYYRKNAVRVEQNAVFIGGLHEGTNVDPDQLDSFRRTFLHCLRYVNAFPSMFEESSLRSLIRLAFEAVQNVYDHADRKPLPRNTRIVSYLSLTYYKNLAPHADGTGSLQAYLHRLAGSGLRSPSVPFIQICVNDDGVGIAARQSQNPGIYRGPAEAEIEAVRSAIKAMGSIKLRTNDCQVRGTPGQGFTYIESGLKALNAFATLRTGRLAATFDATVEQNLGFSLAPQVLAFMPGTTIDFLVPLPKSNHSQPELFGGP